MIASQRWLSVSGARFKPVDAVRGCAHLSNYTVEYCEWGRGEPLVLIPGLAGGYELLGPLAMQLSEHYRVISYQLRGENNCFDLRRPFGLVDLVKDLQELLEWMCLERPILFGVSFGGVIALEYAARHAHRLSHLIVQGAGPRLDRSLFPLVTRMVLNRFPLPNDNPFINQFFNLLFGSAQKQDERFNFVTQQCWKTDQSVMAHRLSLVESFDMERRLERIQAPTLALAGNRDVLVSRRGLDELRDGIRQARIMSLPNCGHFAFVTHPGLVAEKVCGFLAN